jgi:pantoate--beta-alanine ligase
VLYRELRRAAELVSAGQGDFPKICAAALAVLEEEGFRPDYFEIRRASDLAEAGSEDRNLVILVAARLGKARLIDNVRVQSPR